MSVEFYFGGALAFLLAMLGWSDQIRGTQERTRLLEKELLEKFNFNWADLQLIIRPGRTDEPKDRLKAVVRILRAGRLTTSEQATMFTTLEVANKTRLRMESRYTTRFWLVFATSAEMFAAGISSVYQKGFVTIYLPEKPNFWVITEWTAFTIGVQWESVWQMIWICLIAFLLYETMRLNFEEQRFRDGISQLYDLLHQGDGANSGGNGTNVINESGEEG